MPGANVAVIGASGGIGRAFVDHLANDDSVGDVHAFARSPVEFAGNNVHGHRLDLTDEASIELAAEHAAAESPLDLVIVASGILHRQQELQPEKSLRQIDPQSLADVLAVNSIGPALVTKHFLPKLRRGHKSVFAALSARVGSINDNRLGGWTSYRMSKAALNMLIKTAAIEQARGWPEAVVVGLHPGTVDTNLSQPFTSRVEPAKLFSPAYSAGELLKVLDALDANDSGGFFAYDKSRIEY